MYDLLREATLLEIVRHSTLVVSKARHYAVFGLTSVQSATFWYYFCFSSLQSATSVYLFVFSLLHSMSRPVDSNIIEQHKENITPLPGGRPVSKLAANLSMASKSMDQYRQKQLTERTQFERSLLQAEELDDPLQLYVDYIQWTHDSFPQGSNADSGLLGLLERCTSCFRDTEYYKNDPRYLKVWLEYTNYSDSPREIFIYLSKKEIGNKLALYYEQFAQYLEATGKINDAKQVYELGIELNARPVIRLQKTYTQFLQRTETRNLSPSTIRNVLAVKQEGNPLNPSDHESNPKKRQKIEIYNDNDTPSFKGSLLDSSAVKELGSIKARSKENVFTPKPWQGEIMKQSAPNSRPTSKFEVFRDQADQNEKNEIKSDANGLYYTIIRQPGKNTERVSVNMDLVYPSPSEEYCFEEILAMNRRFKPKTESRIENSSKTETRIDNSSKIEMKIDNSSVKDDSTYTIPLKDDSGVRPNSPTITMYSRMATNDVYKMFNQAAHNLTDDDFDKTEQENTNYDEFVTETIRIPPVATNEPTEVTTPPTDHYDTDDEVPVSTQSSPFIERPSHLQQEDEPQTQISLHPELHSELLRELPTPLSSYPGYFYSHSTINKVKSFQNITNHKTKVVSKGANSIINYCGDQIYCLRYELGTGGYGVVYLVETEVGTYKAMKIESPASAWEFYILSEIHKRVDRAAAVRFVVAESLSCFQDESYLVLQYCHQGTLLDVVNLYKNQDNVVDEVLCIFLTIELLRLVEALHQVGIIHGDLKADNCMVRFGDGPVDENFRADGGGGWGEKGLTLIDFGRAVDVTRWPRPRQFVSTWETDEQDCPSMRQGASWAYDADYYGVAAIIHTLLFGDYISTRDMGNNRGYKLTTSFKRYWQVQLWQPLFDLLLNPYTPEAAKVSRVPEIRAQRHQLEEWLAANSVSRGLKRIITTVEVEVNAENRRRLRALK